MVQCQPAVVGQGLKARVHVPFTNAFSLLWRIFEVIILVWSTTKVFKTHCNEENACVNGLCQLFFTNRVPDTTKIMKF